LTLGDGTRGCRIKLGRAALLFIFTLASVLGGAQDLAPRAYIITPIHSNAITVASSFLDGELLFDGSVPITGASAKAAIPVVSLFHSFSLFGRTANFVAGLPYGVMRFRGTVAGAEAKADRSGLLDSTFRLSVNLKGGPAMDVRDYVKWRQKILIGASIKMVAPSGQYDPTKLINLGANRWALKPEFGLSRRWGHWVLDTYAGGWFYTTNHDFFSRNQYSQGTNVQKQSPIFALEGHLSYDVRSRLWTSLDGNFWVGGTTSLNGVENPATQQRNSRIGATTSVPVTKHQSLKFSYNYGAYVKYGGNFHNVSVAWQYSWLGRPN
jgi:outer membrane putative beta-barrel porin/alpha-amylase